MEYNKILNWVKSENIRGYELETDRCIADIIDNFLNEHKEAINYSQCCKSDSELLVLFADWLQYNGKWSTTEQQVKDFLKEQQEQN